MRVIRLAEMVLPAAFIALGACATPPRPEPAACGGLPPGFSPPFACPVSAEKNAQSATEIEHTPLGTGASVPTHDNLKVHKIDGSVCIEIQRDPGETGGLRIPAQSVCPPFNPSTGDQK